MCGENGRTWTKKPFAGAQYNEDAMARQKLAQGIRKFNSGARHVELSQVAQKVG
jgi:transaldolase